jgi:hypothetical protein
MHIYYVQSGETPVGEQVKFKSVAINLVNSKDLVQLSPFFPRGKILVHTSCSCIIRSHDQETIHLNPIMFSSKKKR